MGKVAGILCLLALLFTPGSSPVRGDYTPGVNALVIGDSISVRSEPDLRSRGFAVNAQVGRQWSTGYWASFGEPWHYVQSGLQVASERITQHTVIVDLGTNGPIGRADVEAMLRELAGHRVIFVTVWTDAYPSDTWTGRVNSVLWWAHYRHHIPLVLWSRYASRHAALLVDGIHPDAAGCAVFASLLARGQT